MAPFLTFLTPHYRRPKALAACLASVQAQTAAWRIQQIVIVDHVGLGVGGMFTTLPTYAPAVQGRYVHILCDDDVLAAPDVVEAVEAATEHLPPVIIVKAQKGVNVYPDAEAWPPQYCHIDLGCLIVRTDVWRDHARDYGDVYEGDFRFANAVYKAGHDAKVLDLLFLRGAVSRGAPE